MQYSTRGYRLPVIIRPCRLQLVMPQKDGKSICFLYEATKLMGNNGPYEVSTGCPITAVIRSRRSSKAVSECCTQTSVGQNRLWGSTRSLRRSGTQKKTVFQMKLVPTCNKKQSTLLNRLMAVKFCQKANMLCYRMWG